MFGIGYLLVIAIAALPLVRTILAAGSSSAGLAHGLLHRRYRGALIGIAAITAAIVVFEIAVHISLETYWFAELGQSYRYWLSLGLRSALFVVVFLGAGLFVGSNMAVLCQPLWAFPRVAAWIVGFAFSAIAGLIATQLWIPLIRFLGAGPTGINDPVFGKDLSFYLLVLPFYDDVVGGLTGILIFTVIACALTVFASDQGRDQVQRLLQGGAPAPTAWPSSLQQAVAFDPRLRAAWIRRVLVLAALACVLFGVSRLLDRYHLVINGHSKVVAGASFGDVAFWLPGYDVMIACWFGAAGVLALAAWTGRARGWLMARRAHWLVPAACFVVLYFGALAIPTLLEDLYVGPNQITLEEPYLARSIAGTRRAFGLEGANVEEREFAVSSNPLTRADLDRDAATLRDARIWDWRALEPQLQQIQGLRPYYTFASVDIDRYMVDGVERQVMITARELDVDRLPEQARVWVNLALRYTHGYGAVAVPVNEIDSRGNPVLWAHDIPLVAKDGLAVDRGAIYYGAYTNDHVYVRTTEKEFDFPQGQANAETIYQGRGGIALSDFWRKVVIAHEVDGLRLFISDYFTSESRILIRRNIAERVRTLAPFLTFDHDPYIVADGGHYSYILDAYTSSENYPYSEAYHGSVPGFRGRNYLRNAVKAVVDAYDGTVTFYVFDQNDPIVAAYRRVLPGFFRDAREMPDNLRRHVRYPEDIFIAQAEMYGTYHMVNPITFYNREDRWEVPRELYRDREIEMMPYYVTTQLPGAPQPEFLLMLPMSVAGKNQMAGWLAGRCDGDDYGKLVAFRFPKGIFIDGPAQVESRISSDSRFSANLTLWDQRGSRVIRGNLIVLPLSGNQLIALEPVYIEAEQTRIPTLARIVLAQLLPDNRRIEWAPTLEDAENLLVGAPPAQSAAASAASEPGVAGERLEEARKTFEEMQQQYATGNFARYGELLQQLRKILAPP